MNFLFKNMRMFLATLVAMVMLLSCGDDDATEMEEEEAIGFLDQVATGKIGGDDFKEGNMSRAEESGSSNLYFVLRDKGAAFDNPCGFVGFNGSSEIRFTLPNMTGLYKLGSESENNWEVTFYNFSSKSSTKVDDGAVEITSITESVISGRIKASLNDDNTVNGNFSAKFCQP